MYTVKRNQISRLLPIIEFLLFIVLNIKTVIVNIVFLVAPAYMEQTQLENIEYCYDLM